MIDTTVYIIDGGQLTRKIGYKPHEIYNIYIRWQLKKKDYPSLESGIYVILSPDQAREIAKELLEAVEQVESLAKSVESDKLD